MTNFMFETFHIDRYLERYYWVFVLCKGIP